MIPSKLLIRQRFKQHSCKSDMPLFNWTDSGNYANSPFNLAGLCLEARRYKWNSPFNLAGLCPEARRYKWNSPFNLAGLYPEARRYKFQSL